MLGYVRCGLFTIVTCSSVNNTIGAKNTLRIGSVGYALYIGSYLYVDKPISFLKARPMM